MKKVSKLIAGLLLVAMSASSVMATAGDGILTEGELSNSIGSETINIKYTVSAKFTMNIPEDVVLTTDETGVKRTISFKNEAHSDFVIDNNKKVVVTVSGSGTGGAFTVSNTVNASTDEIAYKVYKGQDSTGTEVTAGTTTIMELYKTETGALADADEDLYFDISESSPRYSGEYTGTVKFTATLADIQ